MSKVKLTITDSRCRCGYFKKSQEFVVEDLCPPLCHELWNCIYLDHGDQRVRFFEAKCPDEGRVSIRGEVMVEFRHSTDFPRGYNV